MRMDALLFGESQSRMLMSLKRRHLGRLRDLARSISSGERAVDRVIAQAAVGRDFSAPELIAIQARVYRYTQELELVSKLVDKACAGVKQTLQTQV